MRISRACRPILRIVVAAAILARTAIDSHGLTTEPEDLATLAAAGKFEGALQSLLQAPEDRASYYYNVGTLHLHLSRLGPAVAYLEKARRMDPFDLDARRNLSLARAQLEKVLGPDRVDPAGTWLTSLSDELAPEQARALVGITALVLAWIWILGFRRTRRLGTTLGSAPSIGGIALLGSALFLFALTRWEVSSRPATFLEPAAVRSGPGPSFLELSKIDAGTKIRVIGSQSVAGDTWWQVRYAAGSVGWAQAKSLLLL